MHDCPLERRHEQAGEKEGDAQLFLEIELRPFFLARLREPMARTVGSADLAQNRATVDFGAKRTNRLSKTLIEDRDGSPPCASTELGVVEERLVTRPESEDR